MAKQALTLAPELAEAHVAVGLFHYYGFREYEPALTEFQRAIELQPNNSLGLQFVAAVHRRQGKWDRTLEELKTIDRPGSAKSEPPRPLSRRPISLCAGGEKPKRPPGVPSRSTRTRPSACVCCC